MSVEGYAAMRAAERAMPVPVTTCPCCGQAVLNDITVAQRAFAAAELVYGVSERAVRGHARDRDAVKARALVVWALRQVGPGLSYEAIGRMLGGRDASTMTYAHTKAIRFRFEDPAFARACRAIALSQEDGHADG